MPWTTISPNVYVPRELELCGVSVSCAARPETLIRHTAVNQRLVFRRFFISFSFPRGKPKLSNLKHDYRTFDGQFKGNLDVALHRLFAMLPQFVLARPNRVPLFGAYSTYGRVISHSCWENNSIPGVLCRQMMADRSKRMSLSQGESTFHSESKDSSV